MQMSNLLSATNTVDSQESLKQQVVAAILSSNGESADKRKRTSSEAEFAAGLEPENSEPVQTRLDEEEEEEDEERVASRQRQPADTLTTTPPHSPHSSYYCDSDNDFMTISSSSFVDHQPPKKPRQQQKQPIAAQQLLKVDIGPKGGEKVIDFAVDCVRIADKLDQDMMTVESQHDGVVDDTLISMMQTPPQSAIIITPNSITTGLSAVDSPQSDASHHQPPSSVVKNEFDFLEETLNRLENDYEESRNQQATIRKQIKSSFGRLRQTQANYFEIYLREQINHSKKENDTSSDLNGLLVDLNYEVQKSKEDESLCVKSRYLDDLTDDEEEQEEKSIHQVTEPSGTRLTESSNKSDIFWGVQRVQLGSEWQRIQAKMSMLKQQNDELTDNKENSQIETAIRIQQLTDSLKESVMNSKAMRIQQLTESLKESAMSSTRTESKPLQPAKQLVGFASNTGNQNRISKCIMTTAAHFKQNVFKTSCLCDESDENEAAPPHHEVRVRRGVARRANRTCICCHPFKTSESTTSIKTRPNALADHTYCKELKFVRRLETKESSNTKLVDDLSLSPKSDDATESKSFTESSSLDLVESNQMDVLVQENFIDPGVELSLQDIKLIPDLTYDELKFLCDEENNEQDLPASRHRLASSFSVASGRVPTDSLLSQSTPQLYTPLIYSPSVTVTTTPEEKALSELKKKRQVARRSANPTPLAPLKDYNTRSRSGSKKAQLKNVLFNKQAVTQSAKEKRKLSGTQENNGLIKKPRVDLSPLSLSGKRKSARSNSTLSTESATPAPLSASTRSPSSAFHFNKFDIDNIILPPEMIISNYKLDPKFIEHRVVPTPRWRVQEINSFPEFEQEIEDLDDETFWKRHETAELKERYFMVYKRMERHQQSHHTQSADKTTGSIKLDREVFEREHQLDTLTLFELRSRVLQLESNEKNQRKRQLSSTSSSSLSNSMSNAEIKSSMGGSQLARTTSNSLLSSSLPQSSLRSILTNKQPVIPAKPHAHMSINSTNRSAATTSSTASNTTLMGPTGLVITHQKPQRWAARKFPLTDVEMNELNSTQ